MHRCAPLGLAAAVLLGAVPARAPAAEASPAWDPLRGPDDAIACVVFPRPAATLATIGAWTCALNEDRGEAGEEAMEDIAAGLRARLGFLPDFERPIVLAAFSPMSRPDPLVAAVPADASAAPPVNVRKAGGWWIWSRTEAGLESLAGAFAAPAGLPADVDVVVHARVAKAYSAVAPILRMQLAMLAAAMGGRDGGRPEMEVFQSLAEDFLDIAAEVETVDATVRFAADGIRVAKTVRAKPDSALAGFAARHATARATAGGALPPAPFRFAASSPDLARLAGLVLGEVLDAGGAGAEDRAVIFEAFDALSAFLGGDVAVSMGKGPAGKAQILVAAASTDASAARHKAESLAGRPDLSKALKGGLGGDVAYRRDAGKIGDLPADRAVIQMDDEDAVEALASFLGTPPEWIVAYPRGFCVAGVGDGAAVALAELASKVTAPPADPSAPPAGGAAFRLEMDIPTTLAIAGGPALLDVMGTSMAPYLEPAPPATIAVRFAPGLLLAEADLPLAALRSVTDAFRTAIRKAIEESMKGLDESSKRLEEGLKELEEEDESAPAPGANWTLDWIGKAAPDIRGKTADGGETSLSSLRGKAVILDFWATWCPPCRAEIPGFIELRKTYGEKGLAILGVTSEPASAVAPFAEKQKMNYPTIVEASELPAPYDRIQAIPTTFVIDRDGKIVAIHIGLREKDEFEEEVKPLLEGR
ncbi:MAG: TlpA family protein disulfide reductase [Planctomycetes bacterium]|nr:TlpA family protein disulfide reductase [Planctomycetota bacterium]